jgi:hypothetical protein
MRCKCGLADVTHTDHVERRGNIVSLHGRDYCDRWSKDGSTLSASKSAKMGLIGLAALALHACSHTQPGVEVRTVEVIKTVQAPCPAVRPERPPPLGELPEHAQQALAQALAALAAYSAPGMYADQAEAWFSACATED